MIAIKRLMFGVWRETGGLARARESGWCLVIAEDEVEKKAKLRCAASAKGIARFRGVARRRRQVTSQLSFSAPTLRPTSLLCVVVHGPAKPFTPRVRAPKLGHVRRSAPLAPRVLADCRLSTRQCSSSPPSLPLPPLTPLSKRSRPPSPPSKICPRASSLPPSPKTPPSSLPPNSRRSTSSPSSPTVTSSTPRAPSPRTC